MPKAQAYNVTMYIMAGLPVIGFIANFLIKAVDERHHVDPNARSVYGTLLNAMKLFH